MFADHLEAHIVVSRRRHGRKLDMFWRPTAVVATAAFHAESLSQVTGQDFYAWPLLGATDQACFDRIEPGIEQFSLDGVADEQRGVAEGTAVPQGVAASQIMVSGPRDLAHRIADKRASIPGGVRRYLVDVIGHRHQAVTTLAVTGTGAGDLVEYDAIDKIVGAKKIPALKTSAGQQHYLAGDMATWLGHR